MALPMLNQNSDNTVFSSLVNVKTIVAIAAGKGGVGKSSMTVNLALALTALGFKIGILDADIYGPSVRKMLPEDVFPVQKKDWIEPAIGKGIKTISMGYFRKENEASAVRAPIANSLIAQFIKTVNWGELDYLLIDFPPGTGDVQLTLCQQIPITAAIMVTTPQEVALLDVRKAASLFDLVQVPILGIIENMSFFQLDANASPLYLFGKGGGLKLAEEYAVPLLGAIPIDPHLCECGDLGLSLFDLDEKREKLLTKSFIDTAKLVIECCQALKNEPFLEIEKISRSDAHHFTIQWKGGSVQSFLFADLQRQCPCAGCVDENTGQRIRDPQTVDPLLEATDIRRVGRYGLQISFLSGCRSGIYSYQFLEGMS